MDLNEERRLLIKVAQLYYENNLTQNEISKDLGISRTTISRMLKKVRELGIVKISINYDSGDNFSLEQKLRERFDLKEAVVVPVEREQLQEVKLKILGQACARFLERVVEDNDVIGLSWGSSLASVVEALEPSTHKRGLFCVPIVGGPSGKLDSKFHVNTLCYNTALKFEAKSLLIDLPAILEKKETRDDIIKSQYFREIADIWKQITVAIFGIGSIEIRGDLNFRAFYGDTISDELEGSKVVGDICSRFFDIQGNLIRSDIYDRTISIQLDQIKKARYSIGIAESLEKVAGIIGALNGGYMNVLVTTEETAKSILERTN